MSTYGHVNPIAQQNAARDLNASGNQIQRMRDDINARDRAMNRIPLEPLTDAQMDSIVSDYLNRSPSP